MTKNHGNNGGLGEVFWERSSFGPPLCTRGSIVQTYDWTIMMVIVAQSCPPLFFVFLYGRTACDELAAVGRGGDTAAGGAEPLAVHGGGGAANCPPVGNRTTC